MSKPKSLSDAGGMPAEILSELRRHEAQFRVFEFSEQFLEIEPIFQIVRELDEICRSDGIVGVHYTRADKATIEAEGLVTMSGTERRALFLEQHGHLFTDLQRTRLLEGWRSYFDKEQNQVRDNRIWFNLTRVAYPKRGAEDLLAHYGGEVIYMPFSQDREIETILGSIGEPMIIECSLDAERVRTFSQNAWGRTWVSSYHCSVNPDAIQFDVDLYTEMSVSAEEILSMEVVRC